MKKFFILPITLILPILNFGAQYSSYVDNQNSISDIQKSMAIEKYIPFNEWNFQLPEQIKQVVFSISEDEYNKQSLITNRENITEKINTSINLETDRIATYFLNNNYKTSNIRNMIYDLIASKYSLELLKTLNAYSNNKWINNVDNRLYITTNNNDVIIFEYDYSTKTYSKLYKIEINVNKTNIYGNILNEITYNMWKDINSYMNKYINKSINKFTYLENFIINEKSKINRNLLNISVRL